ncbi:MAG TPA: YncE family protein [Gemmata sp.]|nr:YncE family protein [Gemmata sp.]
MRNRSGMRRVLRVVLFVCFAFCFVGGCGGDASPFGCDGDSYPVDFVDPGGPGVGPPADPATAAGGIVDIVDARTNAVIDTIRVGTTPRSPAAIPGGRAVYFPDTGRGELGVVDGLSNALIDVVPNVALPSRRAAALPTGKYLYVANETEATVSAVDTDVDDIGRPGNGKVLKRIAVAAAPIALAADRLGRRVYALTVGPGGTSAAVAVIDSSVLPVVDQGVRETFALPTGGGFGAVAAHPNGDFLYYTSGAGVGIVDVAEGSPTRGRMVATLDVGAGPGDLQINSDGSRLFVLSYAAAKVAVVDVRPGSATRHAIVGSVVVGQGPRYLAVRPGAGTNVLYVADDLENSVRVLAEGATDSFSTVATVPLATGPTGIGVHPNGQLVYVCRAGAGPAPVTFADGQFQDNNWAATKIVDTTVGQTASQAVGQAATGGRGGAYRETSHTWTGGDAATSRGMTLAHLRAGAVYDPGVRGPIESVDYSFHVRVLRQTGGTPGMAMFPIVRQNGAYYVHYNIIESPDWTRRSFPGLTAADFTNGTAAPDFSAAGAPIEFGYATSTGFQESVVVNVVGGLDNWTVTVYPPGSRSESALLWRR